MRKQTGAALVMACAAVMASVGVAAPAVAQDEWVMPDVRGEILETAIKDVQSVVGDVELDIRLQPNVNQVVYNYANWAVCATSPRRGGEISQTTRRVIFALRRLNESC